MAWRPAPSSTRARPTLADVLAVGAALLAALVLSALP